LDTFGTIIYEGSKVDNMSNSEETTKDHDVIVNNNLVNAITGFDCHMEIICKESMFSNTEKKKRQKRIQLRRVQYNKESH